MSAEYIVLLMGIGFTTLGIVGKGIFDWLTGRTTARARLITARTEESDSTNRQLISLIKELRTARDRDREEAVKNREAIGKLEQQVKKLEDRVNALLIEAKQQTDLIAEQRARLRGAGVEPPAEPSNID